MIDETLKQPLLWRFEKDYGYGSISGIFLATIQEMHLLFDIAVSVYFGECLGKYSEVTLDFKFDDFFLITNSIYLTEGQRTQFVVGYDPVNYYVAPYLDDLTFNTGGSTQDFLAYLVDHNISHLKDYLEEKLTSLKK